MEYVTSASLPKETIEAIPLVVIDVDNSCDHQYDGTMSRHVRFDSERNTIYSIETLFAYEHDIWWKTSELQRQQEQDELDEMTTLERYCTFFLDFIFSSRHKRHLHHRDSFIIFTSPSSHTRRLVGNQQK